MSDWIPVIGALLGLLTACVGAWRWWAARRDRIEREQLPHVIGRVSEIYQELGALRTAVGAQRALVLRAENGGQIPQVGHDLHSSVVYESSDDDIAPVKPTWHSQRMDESYVKMLARVIAEGRIRLRTDAIPEGSLLRDVYESAGTVWSKVHMLRLKPKEMHYLSVTFDREPSEDPREIATVRDRVRVSASRLSRLLKDV